MELTTEERLFLARHKILPDHVLDARGLSASASRALAKAEGKLFILGSPCEAEGHRLRTRRGHCIECDPANIAFIRRDSAPGYVYIAASKAAQLLKVGSCSDWKKRQEVLSAHKYGGFSDWQIIAWAKTAAMGRIEFEIHKKLEGLNVPGSYEKDGREQATRELFRGDLVAVWQAYHASTAAIDEGLKWRHSGFTHFNFVQRKVGTPSR